MSVSIEVADSFVKAVNTVFDTNIISPDTNQFNENSLADVLFYYDYWNCGEIEKKYDACINIRVKMLILYFVATAPAFEGEKKYKVPPTNIDFMRLIIEIYEGHNLIELHGNYHNALSAFIIENLPSNDEAEEKPMYRTKGEECMMYDFNRLMEEIFIDGAQSDLDKRRQYVDKCREMLLSDTYFHPYK